MTKDECVWKGRDLLERALREKNAEVAFRASYYFFWAEDFEPAKRAVEIAHSLNQKGFLPSGCESLMDPLAHSAIARSFEEGIDEVLRLPAGAARTSGIESALRQSGLGFEETRKIALGYVEYNPVVFLRARILSTKL